MYALQRISFLAGTGTTDTVFDVTVTASAENAHLLSQEYPAALTFTPSLNGTAQSPFTVSVTAQEDGVTDVLAIVSD